MTTPQITLVLLLAVAIVLFAWERWRYDLVAIALLIATVVLGLVPAGEAFLGFGHPAVITVAAVLIITRALLDAGVVDPVARALAPLAAWPTLQVTALTAVVTAASGFMNNVGALALVMPIAMRQADAAGRPASDLLMPIAFGSLLGGLITLIGTPPNLVVSAYRAQIADGGYAMFAFSPVGVPIAVVGALFVGLVGWRLLPKRRSAQGDSEALFRIDDYLMEAKLPADSDFVERSVRDLEALGDGDVSVAGIVRGSRKILAPSGFVTLRQGDILLLEGTPEALKEIVKAAELAMTGSGALDPEALRSDRVRVVQVVVPPGSRLENRTARSLALHARYAVNLLAVARQGRTVRERIGRIRLRGGDLLMLQGEDQTLREAIADLGTLPLAARDVRIGAANRPLLPLLLFAAGIAATAAGLLEAHIAFAAVALALGLAGRVPLRELYEGIEWPVIVLIGAMLPIGGAIETSGLTGLIADVVGSAGSALPGWAVLAILMTATILLSDAINNSAAALIMAPIAAGLAAPLGLTLDAMLMTVAVGSSCTFLTPIGHHSNALVMGPGGYRFADYWRMGLPLDLLVLAVGVPAILMVWG